MIILREVIKLNPWTKNDSCPPQAFFVADWLISKKYSQPTEPLVYILHCIICMLMFQKHELPVLAMFVNRSKINNRYRGPFIDATYHVSVHLAKRFRSRRFVGNLPTWSAQTILVADWSIPTQIFYFETAWPNEPKRGR
jgi:hypothetical protein